MDGPERLKTKQVSIQVFCAVCGKEIRIVVIKVSESHPAYSNPNWTDSDICTQCRATIDKGR